MSTRAHASLLVACLFVPTSVLADDPEAAPAAAEAVAPEPSSVTLEGLSEALNTAGLTRVARLEQRGVTSGTPWTLTLGATDTQTFLCFGGAPPLPRCFTIEAGAESFQLPMDPTRGFPLRVGIGVEVRPGDVEEMMFELATPDGEPRVAIANFLGTSTAQTTLPRILVSNEVPALVGTLGEVEIIQRAGPVMYAELAGMLSACEQRAGRMECTRPVRVAAPGDLVVLDPDAQGPDVFEVEIESIRTDGLVRDERIQVAVFGRDDDGRLELGSVMPFGGERRVLTATQGGDADISEVLYEQLEPAGRNCIRIGRPELEHRLEPASGPERPLGRLRTTRMADSLTRDGAAGDTLMLDSSGIWQFLDGGGMRRVSRCPS